jgi:hypothetical protein
MKVTKKKRKTSVSTAAGVSLSMRLMKTTIRLTTRASPKPPLQMQRTRCLPRDGGDELEWSVMMKTKTNHNHPQRL